MAISGKTRHQDISVQQNAGGDSQIMLTALHLVTIVTLLVAFGLVML